MTGSQWIWRWRRWFYRATWAELIRFWMAPQWWPLFLAPWKDILTSHSPFGCLALSLGKTIFWGGWGQKNKNFVNSSGFILWEFAVRWLIWSHSPFFLFAFLTAYYIKPVYLHKENLNKQFMYSIQYLYSSLEEVRSWQSAWRWYRLDRRWILVPPNLCKEISAQEEGRIVPSQLRQSLKHLYISLIIHLFMFNLKLYVLAM